MKKELVDLNWFCSQLGVSWKLTSTEFKLADGTQVYPFGERPIGIYANWDIKVDVEGSRITGSFASQVLNPDRPKFEGDFPTPEEALSAFSGCVAYYGTFEAKQEHMTILDFGEDGMPNRFTGKIVSHVEGALDPGWMNGEQIRYFEAQRGKVTFRPPTIMLGGIEVNASLDWERL